MNDTAPADRKAADALSRLRIERETAPRTRVWPWAVGALLIAGTALAAWMRLSDPGPISVRTALAKAVAGDATAAASVLDASGYVTARRQATVSSEITGKISGVSIEEGMVVTAGQVLARLDDSTERAELDLTLAQLSAARAALAGIEAQLAEARQNLERVESLAARRLVSQQDLDAASTRVTTLAADLETGRENVKVAESTVALRRQQLEKFVIRAPFGGVVIAKNAQPGEMISPISAGGGFTRTGICTIVDMESLEVEVDVNEAYIQRVSAGQPVTATLDAYPQWQIPAEVIAIIPAADRQRATVRVRIGFRDRDPRILPDMGVKVAFLEDEPPAGQTTPQQVSVTRDAVVRRDGRDVVFVVSGGRAAQRNVSIADAGDGTVRVLQGLAAGERVVLDPPEALADGTAVEAAT